VANDSKQAELKSGLVADPAWDFDYVTMFSRPICEVNVKEKPLESCERRKKEENDIKMRRPGPLLMAHAIPFHLRNVVAIPKDLAFPSCNPLF